MYRAKVDSTSSVRTGRASLLSKIHRVPSLCIVKGCTTDQVARGQTAVASRGVLGYVSVMHDRACCATKPIAAFRYCQDGNLFAEGPLQVLPSSREALHRPLSRRTLLKNARAALGIGLVGIPAATCSWGFGLGQGGVRSAEAFGGPSRPLSR